MSETRSGNGKLPDGRVVRVIGPVVDAEFPPDAIPEIDTALTVERTLGGETSKIVCEVAMHVGDNIVRAVAMRPTDGVVRGSPVVNTGAPMMVPVGPATLGHVFNVLGEPLDTDSIDADTYWPIHRSPPPSKSTGQKVALMAYLAGALLPLL